MDMPVARTETSLRSAPRPAPSTADAAPLHERMTLVRRRVRAGEYLYHSGQPFTALFLVESGLFRSAVLAADGREQVTGFRMHGELLGLESIGLPTCGSDVLALEDAEVLVLPWDAVQGHCCGDATLQAWFAVAMAEEIRRDHAWMLRIGTLTAEHRVAAFLLDFAAREGSPHFTLPMARPDIASFLGVQHETVTRALAKLVKRGLISVLRREVRLLDVAQLCASLGEPAPTLH